MRNLLIVILIVLFSSCSSPTTLQSPNHLTQARFQVTDQEIFLTLLYRDDTIIDSGNICLFGANRSMLDGLEITDYKTSVIDETWSTINGKNAEVRNHYTAYRYTLTNSDRQEIQLEARLYDDGFAYRFILPSGWKEIKDSSSFDLPENLTFWAYNRENHNIGPEKLSNFESQSIHPPVTFQTDHDNYFTVLEAAIMEHAPFELSGLTDETGLQLTQIIHPDQQKTRTSWRAFILAEKPGDLIESNLLVNLNEPCKIEDPSWIKPGRAMWDWRVWGYTAPDGFEYGLNTLSHMRFIDFAAENNVQYLLLDADWYGPEFSEESDPTTTREGIDIEKCMAYAKEKDIGIILYLNDVGARKFGLERVLRQFADWGASGVKYGFMQGDWEQKVKNTRKIVELCAQYHLIVDFHDNPVPPSGDRRTWPNLITREFGHSQADAKKSYYPETIVTAPFVNMIAGPLDLCNGWFSLNSAYGNGRQKVFEEIPGTVAAEVAKLIVIDGSLFILPDAPEEYLKKDDLFDCIRNMPAQFSSYQVIDGAIGEFIVVARQGGDDWFIGSLTNRDGREIQIDFGFLDPHTSYSATFYEDTPATHYLTNKEDYRVRKIKEINQNTQLTIKLAPGGGHAIWLKANLNGID